MRVIASCRENPVEAAASRIRCSVCATKKPGRICWMAMPDVRRPTSATRDVAKTSLTFSRPASAARPRGSMVDQSGVDRDGEDAGGSVLGEGISDAPHRSDVAGLRRVRLDLVADVADVDVDGPLVLLQRVVVVAHELEQLRPRVDAPWARGEVAEEVELCGGEADALRAA